MNTILETLFDNHYSDGPSALKQFRNNIKKANLNFEIETNIAVLESPPQKGFPNGMPSFVYYYLIGTRFGTNKKIPTDSSPHSFTSDGVGLNMGCPIRLARALAVLFTLKAEDQSEPLSQIKTCENHFATVEELLWLTLWKQQTEVKRGGELLLRKNDQKQGDIDWFFFSDGTPIYLEAKFRPTDWLRTSDTGGQPVGEKFFGEIGHKFPAEKSRLRKCVAAITGFAEPQHDNSDNSFFAFCEKKLIQTPGLDAILYRSLLGPIYVCSLDKDIVAQIFALIRYPALSDYPHCYPVCFNRQLHEKRATISKQKILPEQGRMYFAIAPDNMPIPSFESEYPYRYDIPRRGPKGEPYFQNIPPFIESA